MSTENNRKPSSVHVHDVIGVAISKAKKKLYAANKQTANDLEIACKQFLIDLASDLSAVVPGLDLSEPQTNPHAQNVPNPISDRNDLADAIAMLLQSDLTPPALRDAVRDYITDAPRPSNAPDEDAERHGKTEAPLYGDDYDKAIEALGLDMVTIDKLAEEYTVGGDDTGLVLTIGLVKRLLNLEQSGCEELDNYLPRLIDRLFRATLQCETMSETFAEAAEARLPKAEPQDDKGGDE